MTDPVAELSQVWLALRGTPVLEDVSLRISPNEYLAILGPNGAGKSTLLKVLLGLLSPDRGSARVLGKSPRRARGQVGYVPQDPSSLLFADTVRNELQFTRRAHNMRPADTNRWLTRLGLTGLGERYPRDLSVGERQRAALAAILVAEPSILLLDEPTRGLDPLQIPNLLLYRQEERDLLVSVEPQTAMERRRTGMGTKSTNPISRVIPDCKQVPRKA